MSLTPDSVCTQLMQALASSQTMYHCTDHYRTLLLEAGFEDYTQKSLPQLQPGDRGFFVKNGSSLLAFQIGTHGAQDGFRLIGAHTDSPAIQIKPNPWIEREGTWLLNTEIYGGGILQTWVDRPLSLAGRVLYRHGEEVRAQTVDFESPFLVIPNLAIHMNRKINEGVAVERQKHLLPVVSLSDSDFSPLTEDPIVEGCAQRIGCASQDILDFDLYLYDPQPPVRLGWKQELLNAPHLDNVEMCEAGIRALLAANEIPSTSIVYLADNEEVGSRTMQGAQSLYLKDQLERIHLACGGTRTEYLRALEASFFLSADQAHAIHPLYPEVADPTNRPKLNQGPVIKRAANRSYTTDGVSAACFRMICAEAGVPCQIFVNHSDRPGGSTIGPLATSFLHCRGVDIGNPQWAMHSIRETGGTLDPYYLLQALKCFLARPSLSLPH